jgi:flagellar biogenesis protein FliO
MGVGSGFNRDPAALSSPTSGWWLSSAVVAALLAVCGAICVGARKHWPQSSTVALRIVGRTSLSPRHSIVLVQAGPRTLMIGLGPQAAPTLLGELPACDPQGVDIRLGESE